MPPQKMKSPLPTNTVRYPNSSTQSPPRNCPAIMPPNSADAIVPSANERYCAGVVLMISVCAAETVPVSAPRKRRCATSRSGEEMKPIIGSRSAAPKFARSSIIRRPYTSATMPQIGAKMQNVRLPATLKAATYQLRSSSGTPSSVK